MSKKSKPKYLVTYTSTSDLSPKELKKHHKKVARRLGKFLDGKVMLIPLRPGETINIDVVR